MGMSAAVPAEGGTGAKGGVVAEGAARGQHELRRKRKRRAEGLTRR